jgi:DNA recombination protein RmuC
MDLLSLLVGLFGGLISGFVLARFLGATRDLGPELDTSRAEVLRLSQELAGLRALQPEVERSRLAEKQGFDERLKAQKEHFEEVLRQSKSQFESLAQSVLEAKSKTFTEQSEKNLETVLRPLREKLTSFEKRVEDTYVAEGKERHALKSEIERLVGLNDRMSKDTQALTQALRGDSKTQGDWGETILERVLEEAGLREGHEYTKQGGGRDADGTSLRPDIVINLPENHHLIIDSKVSLTAYEAYTRAPDEPTRERFLAEHLRSIAKHIDDLHGRHYSGIKGVNAPDFVFLFMPIEPAYLLAAREQADLGMRALRKNVAFVTTNTLFATLRTVAQIWRLENQNKNAQQIAFEGAQLYDKFVGFLEDFEDVGKKMTAAQGSYGEALRKLKDGPGNLIKKVEVLRELGAAPKKRIRADLLE